MFDLDPFHSIGAAINADEHGRLPRGASSQRVGRYSVRVRVITIVAPDDARHPGQYQLSSVGGQPGGRGTGSSGTQVSWGQPRDAME